MSSSVTAQKPSRPLQKGTKERCETTVGLHIHLGLWLVEQVGKTVCSITPEAVAALPTVLATAVIRL